MECKQQRAAVRLKSLRIKRSRLLQSRASSVEDACPKHPCSNLHRNARTLVRTFLAKGAVEACTDIPRIPQNTCTTRGKRRNRPDTAHFKPASMRKHLLKGTFDCDPDMFGWLQYDYLEMQPDGEIAQVVESTAADSTGTGASGCVGVVRAAESFGAEKTEESSAVETRTTSEHARVAPQSELQGFALLIPKDLLASCVSLAMLVQAITQGNGVGAFLIQMEEHMQSASAQACGCRLLSQIVACHSLGELGLHAARVVMLAMRAHESCAELQLYGLNVLKALAAQKLALRDDMAASSGVEVTISAMRKHSASAAIQVASCGVIRNVTMASSSDVSMKRQASIARNGGLDAVISAMSQHRCDSAVQLAGCWALACVSSKNPSVQTAVAAMGGACAVLQAMEAHKDVASVQEAACWALKEMSAGNEPIVEWSNRVRAVSRAMREHRIDTVQKAACVALRKLATRTPSYIHANVVPLKHRLDSRGKKRRCAKPELPVIKE
eukprot:TRINITY_DN64714_c0_g1_i1.p1 TRINITY_DN64714_c0_g1~~TRINITY_DN64714_c0_g1_i1.p1  ORF type:complete len:521 (-),score=53.89 TRINITY_DN64714_c0_g1_i1:183-1673(-)